VSGDGRAVLLIEWDLSDPAATCTTDDLERGVHEAGLDRFTGLEGLHVKVWFRDGERYGSLMLFSSPAARDTVLPWIADRVTERCGLAPVRVEPYEAIAVAEGAAGIAGIADGAVAP
jgi:hypothetical protein